MQSPSLLSFQRLIERRTNRNNTTIIGVWITDIEITEVSVVDITRAARARWMIENECFNILRNQGAAIGSVTFFL